MKDYFIRLIFGLLTIGIVLGIDYIFNINWVQEGNPGRNLFILPITIVGGWGGWYLYKAIKKEKR
ncbi:hypothetical protein [Halalkalibacter lacteus]|uniref:hypothetical protein n=1 Tax=Halalkalibacter lacteus TaxID=3090663 RepID=UPI002FC86BC4